MFPVTPEVENDGFERRYRDLLNHLNNDKCVLLLGPELSVNKEGVDYKS